MVQGAYQGYVTASRLLGDRFVDVGLASASEIPLWAEELANTPGVCSRLPATAIAEHMRVQHELLFKYDVPIAETMSISALNGISLSQYWILFPFSRGCVHTSKQGRDKPLIDPNLYGLSVDVDMAIETGKLSRDFWATEPIGGLIQSQILPGEDVLPNNATAEQWEDFVRSTSKFPSRPGLPTKLFRGLTANVMCAYKATKSSHGFGTAAMMKRSLGGVVDAQLRVYGTGNVRVVDSSVIPMQISGHSTATLYAMAERAADIIKGIE